MNISERLYVYVYLLRPYSAPARFPLKRLSHTILLSFLRLVFTDRFGSFYAIYDGRRTSSIYTLPAKHINYKMRFSPFEDKKAPHRDAFLKLFFASRICFTVL